MATPTAGDGANDTSSSTNRSAGSSSSSASTAGSAGGARDATAVATVKTNTTNADSCTWYADSKCTKPRTCMDCLNVGIPSGQCAIDPRGACVPIAEYESFTRARNYFIPNYKYYPSTTITYCTALDSICQSCKQKWIDDYNTIGNTPAIPFCQGASGCVCVAYCELPGWSDTVIGNQCTSTRADAAHTNKMVGAVTLTAGVCVLFLAVAIALRYTFKRFQWNATGGRRVFVPREPIGPSLALDGWKSMRQELIAKERYHIEGREVPVTTTAMRPRTDTTRNALGEAPLTDATAAAAMVVMEYGDGFRPASPSELARGDHHASSATRP